MAAVTVVHPRSGRTEVVNDVEALAMYVHNWGWAPQSGTYAQAVETITGVAPVVPDPDPSSWAALRAAFVSLDVDPDGVPVLVVG